MVYIPKKQILMRFRRYKALNETRLNRALAVMSHDARICLSIVPVLLHYNHINLPGYRKGNVPHGIDLFKPDSAQLSYIKEILVEGAPPLEEPKEHAILGLYAMGSTSSLGQSDSSDLDIWVCVKANLSPEATKALQEKCRFVSSYVKAQGVELNLFVTPEDRFTNYKPDSLDEENCGSAQNLFLLDEFYRSSIRLCGRYIIWYIISTNEERENYQDYLDFLLKGKSGIDHQKLLEHGLINKEDVHYIDAVIEDDGASYNAKRKDSSASVSEASGGNEGTSASTAQGIQYGSGVGAVDDACAAGLNHRAATRGLRAFYFVDPPFSDKEGVLYEASYTYPILGGSDLSNKCSSAHNCVNIIKQRNPQFKSIPSKSFQSKREDALKSDEILFSYKNPYGSNLSKANQTEPSAAPIADTVSASISETISESTSVDTLSPVDSSASNVTPEGLAPSDVVVSGTAASGNGSAVSAPSLANSLLGSGDFAYKKGDEVLHFVYTGYSASADEKEHALATLNETENALQDSTSSQKNGSNRALSSDEFRGQSNTGATNSHGANLSSDVSRIAASSDASEIDIAKAPDDKAFANAIADSSLGANINVGHEADGAFSDEVEVSDGNGNKAVVQVNEMVEGDGASFETEEVGSITSKPYSLLHIDDRFVDRSTFYATRHSFDKQIKSVTIPETKSKTSGNYNEDKDNVVVVLNELNTGLNFKSIFDKTFFPLHRERLGIKNSSDDINVDDEDDSLYYGVGGAAGIAGEAGVLGLDRSNPRDVALLDNVSSLGENGTHDLQHASASRNIQGANNEQGYSYHDENSSSLVLQKNILDSSYQALVKASRSHMGVLYGLGSRVYGGFDSEDKEFIEGLKDTLFHPKFDNASILSNMDKERIVGYKLYQSMLNHEHRKYFAMSYGNDCAIITPRVGSICSLCVCENKCARHRMPSHRRQDGFATRAMFFNSYVGLVSDEDQLAASFLANCLRSRIDPVYSFSRDTLDQKFADRALEAMVNENTPSEYVEITSIIASVMSKYDLSSSDIMSMLELNDRHHNSYTVRSEKPASSRTHHSAFENYRHQHSEYVAYEEEISSGYLKRSPNHQCNELSLESFSSFSGTAAANFKHADNTLHLNQHQTKHISSVAAKALEHSELDVKAHSSTAKNIAHIDHAGTGTDVGAYGAKAVASESGAVSHGNDEGSRISPLEAIGLIAKKLEQTANELKNNSLDNNGSSKLSLGKDDEDILDAIVKDKEGKFTRANMIKAGQTVRDLVRNTFPRFFLGDSLKKDEHGAHEYLGADAASPIFSADSAKGEYKPNLLESASAWDLDDTMHHIHTGNTLINGEKISRRRDDKGNLLDKEYLDRDALDEEMLEEGRHRRSVRKVHSALVSSKRNMLKGLVKSSGVSGAAASKSYKRGLTLGSKVSSRFYKQGRNYPRSRFADVAINNVARNISKSVIKGRELFKIKGKVKDFSRNHVVDERIEERSVDYVPMDKGQGEGLQRLAAAMGVTPMPFIDGKLNTAAFDYMYMDAVNAQNEEQGNNAVGQRQTEWNSPLGSTNASTYDTAYEKRLRQRQNTNRVNAERNFSSVEDGVNGEANNRALNHSAYASCSTSIRPNDVNIPYISDDELTAAALNHAHPVEVDLDFIESSEWSGENYQEGYEYSSRQNHGKHGTDSNMSEEHIHFTEFGQNDSVRPNGAKEEALIAAAKAATEAADPSLVHKDDVGSVTLVNKKDETTLELVTNPYANYIHNATPHAASLYTAKYNYFNNVEKQALDGKTNDGSSVGSNPALNEGSDKDLLSNLNSMSNQGKTTLMGSNPTMGSMMFLASYSEDKIEKYGAVQKERERSYDDARRDLGCDEDLSSYDLIQSFDGMQLKSSAVFKREEASKERAKVVNSSANVVFSNKRRRPHKDNESHEGITVQEKDLEDKLLEQAIFDDWKEDIAPLNEDEWFNFGSVVKNSPTEYFGSGLWLLYKAIDSPFKVVLKILLMEAYSFDYPYSNLLSSELKDYMLSHDGYSLDLDSYYLMYLKVSNYLQTMGHEGRLTLMRKCFYLKIYMGLNNKRNYNKEDYKVKRELLNKFAQRWRWSEKFVSDLENVTLWRMASVRAFNHEVYNTLLESYQALLRFSVRHGIEYAITSDDMGILSRKLYAAFDRYPGKILVTHTSFSHNLAETNLCFIHPSEGSLCRRGWHLYTAAAEDVTLLNTKVSFIGSRLAETVTWACFNGLLTSHTKPHVIGGSSSVTPLKIKLLTGDIMRILVPKKGRVSESSLQRTRELKSCIVVLNLERDETEVFKRHLVDTNYGSTLCCGRARTCLVGSVDLVLINSWGEIRCVPMPDGEEGVVELLASLVRIVNNSTEGGQDVASMINLIEVCSYADAYQDLIKYDLEGTIRQVFNCMNSDSSSEYEFNVGRNTYIARNWDERGVVINRKSGFGPTDFDVSVLSRYGMRPEFSLQVPPVVDRYATSGIMQYFFAPLQENGHWDIYIINERNEVSIYNDYFGSRAHLVNAINRFYTNQGQNKSQHKLRFNLPQYFVLSNDMKTIHPFTIRG